MEDPTTKQVELLVSKDATKMAFILALVSQLRQWPWGRIVATPAGVYAFNTVTQVFKLWLS